MLPMAGADGGDTAAAPFERIAIVGFGLIGASIALAARGRWPSALLIAVDRKDVIETAMRMHAADVGGDDLVMAAEADLIILAAPVRANIRILGELLHVHDIHVAVRAIEQARRTESLVR